MWRLINAQSGSGASKRVIRMPRIRQKSKALAALAAVAGFAGVASMAPDAKALQSTSVVSSDTCASPAAVAVLRAKAANPADRMAQNRTFGERQWAEIKQGRPGPKERIQRVNPRINPRRGDVLDSYRRFST
jgi:hypothetical protein